MRKGCMLLVCVLAVTLVAVGCKSTGTGSTGTAKKALAVVPGYSDAVTLQTQGQYDAAMQKFQDYVAKNGQGAGAQMVPFAQVRIAQCQVALKRMDDAKASYEMVKKNYPNTESAELADAQLKAMATPTKPADTMKAPPAASPASAAPAKAAPASAPAAAPKPATAPAMPANK
jgi:hypothetical protein